MYKFIVFFMAVILTACSSTSKPLNEFDDSIAEVERYAFLLPIYSQKIKFNLPSTWKPAFENQQPSHYIIEFIPTGESIKQWKNIFSFQGFENLSTRISAVTMLNQMRLGFSNLCGKDAVFINQEAIKIDGYHTETAIIGCAAVAEDHPTGIKKGQGEIGQYFIIEGEKDIYVVHKSIRLDAFDPSNPPLNNDNTKEFINTMLPIELCSRQGHQAECIKK